MSGVNGDPGKVFGFVTVGLRRCRRRYEVEDADRGRPGLEEVPLRLEEPDEVGLT